MAHVSPVIQDNRWSREDLTRRLCHALDIAKLAVERLAVQGYTDPDELANSLRPEKLISETALLLLAASTASPQLEVNQRIQCVAECLLPQARSERILLEVCLKPSLALDFAQAHICLARIGFPDSRFDDVLRQIDTSQARGGCERPPHRVLEQEWLSATRTGSKPRSPKDTSPTALTSVLNRPMDLLNGSREDLYAFTHALMYIADFNLQPSRLPRPRAAILAEAEAALARCLDDEDYDLGGEVLLAWPLTGNSWSAASGFGFRVLAHVEDQAGFLPAPSTRLKRLNELQGDARTDYLLATAYHTAYVMGLLCAAALQPGRTPPSKIRSRNVVPGAADKVLPFLQSDGDPAHWRDQLSRLTELERDSIAGFLLAMALRRKARDRDFAALRELLAVGYGLGLADTPASSQAAELLQRLATFAEVTRSAGRQLQVDPA